LSNISAGYALKPAEETYKTVNYFADAVGAFIAGDISAKNAAIENVRQSEHQADESKKILIGSIVHAKLEPADLLLSYQLAEYLEGVTDKIEPAADLIKILAIKSK
jgi:uncharacterized protein Yka (UPF0111/DUF47 family)